jgi:hypothetical protein
MYNESERIWFNQEILLCYGKKVEEVSATLSLTIGTCTKDFLQYSVPTLLIRITDPSKSLAISLDRCSCRKILNFLQVALKKETGIYQTKIYGDKNIKVAFRPVAGGINVVLGLVNGVKEAVIVCGVDDLEEIKETIRSFLMICTSLACQNLFTRKEIYQQSGLLRTLPSQMFPVGTADSFNIQPKVEESKQDTEEKEDPNNINNEFSKFLDDKVPEIELEIPEAKDGRPDLENGQKKVERKTIHYGSLVQTLLNNNISELESLCSVLVTSENPIYSLVHTLNEKIKTEEYDSSDLTPVQKFFPSINEQQLKAMVYVSRLTYFRTMKRLMNTKPGTPASLAIETSYYIPDESSIRDYNKNIAIDILLLVSYVREVQRILNHVEGNVTNNKSVLYSQLRLFFDPLMISFVRTFDIEGTINTLKGRFNQYKEEGVFKEFEEYIAKYKCTLPTESAVATFAEQVMKKLQSDSNEALVKLNDASKKDKFMFDSATINTFNIEQITKEISRLESGTSIDHSNLSKEVADLFGYVVPIEEETPLGKFVRENIKEVPESMRKDFLLELNKECKDDKYDFIKNREKFNIDKLGDIVVVALWVWNPKEADLESKDYGAFMEMFRAFAETYNTPESINDLRATIQSQSEGKIEKTEKDQSGDFYEAITDDLFDI